MPGPWTGANCRSRCQAFSTNHFDAMDDVFWLFSDVLDPFCGVTTNCSNRNVCEVGFARVLGCSGQKFRAQPLPTEKKINKKLPNLGLAFNYVIPLAGEQAPPPGKRLGEHKLLKVCLCASGCTEYFRTLWIRSMQRTKTDARHRQGKLMRSGEQARTAAASARPRG